jgi:hypothetical protein
MKGQLSQNYPRCACGGLQKSDSITRTCIDCGVQETVNQAKADALETRREFARRAKENNT